MDNRLRTTPLFSRKLATLKSCFTVGFGSIFLIVLVCMTMGGWLLNEHVSIAAASKLYVSRLSFARTQQAACSKAPHEQEVFVSSEWGTRWNLDRVLKSRLQEQVNGSIAAREVVPATLATTPAHEYPGVIGTFYLMSAYYDSRFQNRAGAPHEDRLILLVMANELMRKGWTDGDVPVQDGWGCLLCSFASDVHVEDADFHGPPPSMTFTQQGADTLNCWWSSDTRRSYQSNDIHDLDYGVAQFQCKAPGDVPMEKISLATLANTRLQKYNKLEEVLFASIDLAKLQTGIKKVAVPSFERFKRVQRIRYVDREEYSPEDDGEDDEADVALANTRPRISLCVGPIFGAGSEFVEEWVAFHRMMGVNHFHVYYLDSPSAVISPTLLRTLKYFSMKGFLTLYHTDITFADPDSKTEGISSWKSAKSTMVMDCYYRAAGASDYVMWLDLDEFLGPANVTHADWFEPLEPFFNKYAVGTMVFPHWWYRLHERKANVSELHTELVTASAFSRGESALGYDEASLPKCMARVGSVRLQSIHLPVIPVPGYRVENVSPDIVFLRHYRNPGGDAFNESNRNSSEDHAFLRFQELLHLTVKDIKHHVQR